MSDSIQHECGLALLRLRKPLQHFADVKGSPLWGLRSMYLLMEKQHNRGQDGAGLACCKLQAPFGSSFLSRERVVQPSPPWSALFQKIEGYYEEALKLYPTIGQDVQLLNDIFPFAGEVYLGHLRYGTHGLNKIENCHPVVRRNNWRTRNLMIAGNFNLTNVDDLFKRLIELGQHPRHLTDTETVLERVGHFLDVANQKLFDHFHSQGFENEEISQLIADNLDVVEMVRRSANGWDGGYTMGGVVGHGDAFVARDPSGIRPAYYYVCDDFIVVASERPAIATVFHVDPTDIQEIPPGHVLVVKRNGDWFIEPFTEPRERKSCTFERIYFSRGNDVDIYKERKQLGRLLAPQVLDIIGEELQNTVFSFIPNTSLTAYLGMIKELEVYLSQQKGERIAAAMPNITAQEINAIITERIRVENVIVKDTKMRTFISDESSRNEMAGHVYDITYGAIRPNIDNLVCIDDSIVRGTTLQRSILKILSRLSPRKLVIVSSAPQIRYPDCYGIDMSLLQDFIAFKAAIELLRERSLQNVIEETYQKCLALKADNLLTTENCVKAIYAPFTDVEISAKIAQIVNIPELKGDLYIVYQTIENLRKALPETTGDWYFTGDFPTPGGNKVCNQAFINFYENKRTRAY